MAPPCTWPTAGPATSSRSTSTRPAAAWTGENLCPCRHARRRPGRVDRRQQRRRVVALWNGAAAARYAPDGVAARATPPIPVDRPTSCAFGGRDGATLSVTTSREGLDPAASPASPTRETCRASTAWESPGRPARPTEAP